MNTTALELFLATLLIALAAAHFMYRARTPHRCSMTDMAVWAMAPFFGISAWISFNAGGGILPPLEPSILIGTYLSILLFMIGVLFSSWLINRIFPSRDVVPPGVTASRSWIVMAGGSTASVVTVVVLYGASIAARLIVGIRYGMFLLGDSFSSDMPEALGDFLLVSELFTSAAVLWASVTLITTRRHRFIAIAILVVDCLLCMSIGRRLIMVDLMTFVYVYFSFKGFNPKLFLRAGIATVIALVMISAFDRIRYYHWTIKSGSSGLFGYVESVNLAIEDPDKMGRIASNGKNYVTRPIACSRYIAMILQAQSNAPSRTYLDGRTYLAAVVHCIPYALYPEKRLVSTPEPLMQSYYGYASNDYGTTWVVCGVADFGLFGVILGGMLLGSLVSFTEILARIVSPKFPFMALSILGVMIRYLMEVQDTPSGIIASLRQGVALAVICVLFMPLVASRWQANGVSPAADNSGDADADSSESYPLRQRDDYALR